MNENTQRVLVFILCMAITLIIAAAIGVVYGGTQMFNRYSPNTNYVTSALAETADKADYEGFLKVFNTKDPDKYIYESKGSLDCVYQSYQIASSNKAGYIMMYRYIKMINVTYVVFVPVGYKREANQIYAYEANGDTVELLSTHDEDIELLKLDAEYCSHRIKCDG